MKFLELLVEGRADDFKSKFSKKFSQQQIDQLIYNVAPKYLDWVGKNVDAINFEENAAKAVEAVKVFDKISTNLPITDLNQYKTLDQLLNAITTYQNRERRSIKRVEGGNVIYDDGKIFVVNPLTYQSSCYYGTGTKWCTAGLSEKYFKDYNEDGKLFYFLDRTKPTSDPLYKVAILRKFNGDMTYWDAKDDKFTSGWILGTDKYKKIMSAIDEYLNKEYAAQIKIFSDAALAKKEKERLERVRVQQILNGHREEAQERREDNEWELGPNCPDEGLKAHALLNWLVDNENVEVLTNEDRIEIQRLKDEIERLDNEYDNGEEVNIELLNQKGELEDELAEFDDKIDVYNILPDEYDHYGLTRFIVIDAGLDDNHYAVGTDGETQRACEEYLEGLIDDIGVDGFGPQANSILEDNIDADYVRRDAYDMFYDFVHESPESYFDDSQRNLSDDQEDQISILRRKISQNEDLISKMEDMLTDEDSGVDEDEIKDKISELQDENSEMEDEITDIENDPEGDFPEDLMEEKIDKLADSAERDPIDWIKEYGMNISHYVDEKGVIRDFIDIDGYGHTLNTYDGSADEVYVQNVLYYVMRVD